ncbi:MAG TPA: hypothetical protein VFV70_07255 [Hyphomonadaceae bacterium]|nr:hypothetical protein [Hyphomonadaceae bacterium]
MGLFNLFGGKKKDGARAAKPVEAKPAETRPAPASARVASPPVQQITLAASDAGVKQVKLRLKLAASLRAGAHFEAYKAAKGLAAMQAEAGRRVGARMWMAEAERILASQEAA